MEDKNSPALPNPALVTTDDQDIDKLAAGWTPSQDDDEVLRILARDRDRVRKTLVPTADKDAYDVFVANAPPMNRWDLGSIAAVLSFVLAVLLYLSALTVLLWTAETGVPLLLSLIANTLVIAAVAVGIMAPKKD